jgi:D-alanine-D-alanine ligase
MSTPGHTPRHTPGHTPGHTPATPTVLVLGGGPDAEREVSLVSSRAVAEALRTRGTYRVHLEVIDRLDAAGLARLPGEIIFPVLHGGWGEGGPLQELLERDGRAFVGCGSRAARLAMDKIATKLAAARLGIPTPPAAVLNPGDSGRGVALPVVVKPVHEGSSVGVYICREEQDWSRAIAGVRADVASHPTRVYMIEGAVLGGRELTVGVLDGKALPIVEIRPAVEFYDYQAKYNRDDTAYTVSPELPRGVAAQIADPAQRLAQELGVRHLCRVDFLLDPGGGPWLLEVNTLPGFTGHSLFPMAAADRRDGPGLDMPALTEHLVNLARRDGAKCR